MALPYIYGWEDYFIYDFNFLPFTWKYSVPLNYHVYIFIMSDGKFKKRGDSLNFCTYMKLHSDTFD